MVIDANSPMLIFNLDTLYPRIGRLSAFPGLQWKDPRKNGSLLLRIVTGIRVGTSLERNHLDINPFAAGLDHLRGGLWYTHYR
ncbi:hypothetical protein J6590_067612, partial [Homalodisca vitripennis]